MSSENIALDIYKKRPKFTNCYVNYEQFSSLIKEEEFFTIDDNIFILKKENGIFKFLYFVNELDNIKLSQEYLNRVNSSIALEILSKVDVDDKAYQCLGFESYKVFSRYLVTKKNRKSIKKIGKVKVADKDDAKSIVDIAFKVFDPLCDYIPTVDDIEKYIDNEEIFVVKRENNILAFAIYIKESYGYDFRLNCVNPDYESGLAGYSLVSHIPEDGNKCICWIDDKNTPAIRLNESIGFKKDGLKNYIFVKNLNNGDKINEK